jgi:hypothetical protein
VASVLVRLNRRDPRIPVDPELFVASQPVDCPLSDPWQDLAQARAARRYQQRVRQIIRDLRAELSAEVREVENRVRRGQRLEAVLVAKTNSISPLGRYIAAYRAGRLDLAQRFRGQAQDQHASCPLYLHACHKLLPRSAYPAHDWGSALGGARSVPLAAGQFSLN